MDKSLIVPGDTRFNATLDSVEALLAVKDKLNSIMDAIGLRRFDSAEILFLEEYLCLMKPLAMCLDVLQGNSASLGMVLPAITKLEQFWKKKCSDGSLELCQVLAKFLLWNLNERFSEFFDDKDYILGKLVHCWLLFFVPTIL